MSPPALPEAYYIPLGEERYEPTRATTSPWDDANQHGGPPAALLGTCIDRLAGSGGLRLARITVEFLRPIPRREVTVEAHFVRPGRRVAMSEASLSVDGEPVVLARAWHIAAGVEVPRRPGSGEESAATRPPEGPGAHGDATAEERAAGFPGLHDWGYGEATEWSFEVGGFGVPGPAELWTRVLIPLVAGEPLLGYQRALVVADSANGLSSELPLERWLFIPPSLTVHLVGHPAGEWVHMAARTHLGPDGIGLTTAALSDETGLIGTVAQPLLVAPR